MAARRSPHDGRRLRSLVPAVLVVAAVLAFGAPQPAAAQQSAPCPPPVAQTLDVVVDRPAPRARVSGEVPVSGRLQDAAPGRYHVELAVGGVLLDRVLVAAGEAWELRLDTRTVTAAGATVDLVVRACPARDVPVPAGGELRVPVTLDGHPPPETRLWVGLVTAVSGLAAFAVASLRRRPL